MEEQDSIKIPKKVAQDIIKYCEYMQIYDKLERFGEFYYKLKQLV